MVILDKNSYPSNLNITTMEQFMNLFFYFLFLYIILITFLYNFMEIMKNLNLPYPKFIDYAVKGNQLCGVCPDDLPENLQNYCKQMTESYQG